MSYPDYKIEVEQGIIEVNSVAPLHLSEEALLFEADTRQKYPDLLAVGTGSAIISANERTLRVKDPEAPASIIRIVLDESVSSHWHTMVETGRYSVFIGMFKIQLEPDAPIYLRDFK